MKKLASYIIGWAVALGLFNLIVFITPSTQGGESKYDALFWVSYVVITLAFIAQLACAALLLRSSSVKRAFYNFSLLGVSITALISILVVGSACMAIVAIPDWIGIILVGIAVAFNVIAYAKATIAIDAIEDVDKKVKSKTMFIKLLVADAEALVARAQEKELQELAKKAYEAVKYSDPMSDPALMATEDKMTESFARLSSAIDASDIESAQEATKAFISATSERSAKCKILK